MTIYVFAPDLMDKSRFGPVEGEKVFVRVAGDLTQAGPDDLVVADLSRPGVFGVLSDLRGPRRVAFIGHGEAAAIAQAKNLGIEVLPRSRFFSHIVDILTSGDH